LRSKPVEVEAFNSLGGRLVTLPGRRVVEIVGEVGADHEQRLFVNHGVDDFGDLLRPSGADQQRNDGEISKHGLQEGQLDFEGVLRRVRLVVNGDQARLLQGADDRTIDGHFAKRRGEGSRRWRCDAAHRYVVRRTDQQHPREGLGRGCDACEGRCCHAA
jgi:hypothetical protein